MNEDKKNQTPEKENVKKVINVDELNEKNSLKNSNLEKKIKVKSVDKKTSSEKKQPTEAKTKSEKKVEPPVKNKENKSKSKVKSSVGTKKENSNSSSANNKNSRGSNNNKGQPEENEFIEKLVSINRVAKVVKGGRRFSFAALVVVGDGNGLVGHGKGKAKEVPEAIKKATDEAKVNMIRVPLRQARTLHHDIAGRYDAGKVYLRSAPSGTGVIAGGPMRAVFEALGIKDIVAKSVGSSNPHNMIRATFAALKSASSPKLISIRRGLKVNEITKRRKVSNTITESTQDA